MAESRVRTATLAHGFTGGHNSMAAMNWLATQFAPVLASVKDPGFREERESRLVYASVGLPDVGIHFRPSNMGLTPYIKWPIRGGFGVQVPIRAVVVGPGQNMELKLQAARQFLNEHGYWDAAVLPSIIPIRA